MPVQDEVLLTSGEKPGSSAPDYLVESAPISDLCDAYISENILLIDLGEAFLAPSPPPKGVGTPVQYRSPELALESTASKASDIWALVCTIFELRAGFPLFESFIGSQLEVFEAMSTILGRPPDPLHPVWKKALEGSDTGTATSIIARVNEIGSYDTSIYNVGGMPSAGSTLLESAGVRVSKDEARELADLLKKALHYDPSRRSSITAISNHPWLTYKDHK